VFEPLDVFRENFPLAGTIALDRCPVCDSSEIGRLWQLPQSRLGAPTYLNSPGSPFHDFYLDYLPLLRVPQQVFVFDICRFCHSIFRNPKDDDQASYGDDTSKVEAFRAQGPAPFNGIVNVCEKRFPRGAKTVVDAACGAGQALALLKERHPELDLMGLELSHPSVKFINSLGVKAAVVDLDLDDLDPIVPPASVDFILFYEAFEHVRQPVTVLKKLVRMLRRGGRLHFTAQYYGPESSLQVRVGEPIYISRHGLDWVVSQLDAEVHDLVVNIKFRVTLQRR
jgi:SAM-dependent methyltransferase